MLECFNCRGFVHVFVSFSSCMNLMPSHIIIYMLMYLSMTAKFTGIC